MEIKPIDDSAWIDWLQQMHYCRIYNSCQNYVSYAAWQKAQIILGLPQRLYTKARGFTVDMWHTGPLWINMWRGEQLDTILQAIYANNNSQQSLTEAGDYDSCFLVAACIRVCNTLRDNHG